MPRTNYEPHSVESLRVLQTRIQLLEMVVASCIQQLENVGVTQIETLHNLTMERGITHLTTFITALQHTVISETIKQRMDEVRDSKERPKAQKKVKVRPGRKRRVAKSN